MGVLPSLLLSTTFLCLIAVCNNVVGADGDHGNPVKKSLLQVQIIFRHGLRSPEKSYPGDPYSDEKYWPQGWGMLTDEGKRQQYELGRYIRSRYGDFLSEEYSPNEFYALSSDSDRAIMSLQTNLAGIFPPGESSGAWMDVKWQPVPFRTIPRNDDKTIRGSAPCPKFDELWKELLQSEAFQTENRGFKELYEYIGNHTGETYSYPVDLTTFYEALIIQDAHNYTLPPWTRSIFPSEQSTALLNFAFSLVVQTEGMKRLRGGPFLTQLVSNMDSRIRKDPKTSKKMILYSGHDITLARIMDTLNVFNPPHLPDFNSVLFLELHNKTEDNSNYFIEIYYRNGIMGLVQLEIEGCPSPCYLNEFKSLIKSRLISNQEWTQECSEAPVRRRLGEMLCSLTLKWMF